MLDLETCVDDYLATARTTRRLLGVSRLHEQWGGASCLGMWSVAGLAGHLARAVLIVPAALDHEVDVTVREHSAIDYYTSALAGDHSLMSPVAVGIRERGVESAGASQADLLERFDHALAELETSLRLQPVAKEVSALGMRMPLADYLVTRCVEMVVHADDLAVSLQVPTPVFPTFAMEEVLAVLVGVAARRHGATSVLRALARAERSGGSISAFSA